MRRIYASIGLGNESHNSLLVSCPNHDQNSSAVSEGCQVFIGAKLRTGMEPEPSMAPVAQFCVKIRENS